MASVSRSRLHPPARRVATVLIGVVVASAAVAIGAARPAQGQTPLPTFPCDGGNDDTDTIIDPDPATTTCRPDAPPPAKPTGFLPATGGDAVTWAWVAAALLGLGGAAWVAANNTRKP